MGKININLIGFTRKLLIFYYYLALLFGIYNIYATLTPYTPLREAILYGVIWSDFIVIPMGFILIALSILLIILVYKKKLTKINLIYPIYFLSYSIFLTTFNIYVYNSYGLDYGLTILDNFHKYHIIFFIFDIIIPALMMYKQFLEHIKKIIRTIKKGLYI